MTFAEQALYGREYKTMTLPDNFQVYCFKCGVNMKPGTLVQRYSGSQYTHKTCPNVPMRSGGGRL